MKKQSIAGGFAILSFCGLLAKLLSLVYVPVLNSILGTEGHGQYVVTYGVFAFIYTVCNSGLPNSISKLVSEEIELGNERRAQRIFELSRSILITAGAILSVGMFIFSKEIAGFMEFPSIDLAIKVLSPAIFATAVLSAYKGYFQAQRIMTPTGISQVVEQLVNVAISLGVAAVMVKLGGTIKGVAGATTGTTLGAAAAIGIMFYFYKKNNLKDEMASKAIKYKKNDRYLVKKILMTAGPLTFCAALQNLSFIIDPKQLSKVLQWRGMTEAFIESATGFVGKFQSLINVPVAIAMALAIAVLPVISAKIASGKITEAKEKADFAHKLCFLVAMPSIFGLSALAYPIANVFGYTEDVARLIMMGSFLVLFMSLMQVQMAIMQGINKLYQITAITVIGIAVKVLVNFITISKFSFYGVLIGNGISFALIVILGTMVINKTLGEKINFFGNAMKPFMAAVAMGGIVYLCNILIGSVLSGVSVKVASLISILIGLPLGGGVYAFIILVIGTISKDEYEIMPGKIKRIIPRRFIR